jgi:hypothetical protein
LATYDIATVIDEIVFCDLTNVARHYGERGLFVVRDDAAASKAVSRTVERFLPFVVSQSRRSKWPGTELLAGQQATVYEFLLCAQSIQLLFSVSRNVFDWVHPDLPEDICFLDQNGGAWFVSITHERDAYLQVSREQYTSLRADCPELTLRLVD